MTTTRIGSQLGRQNQLQSSSTTTTNQPNKPHRTRRRSPPAADRKLVDICCSLANTLQMPPAPPNASTSSQRNTYARFCLLVGQLLLLCCQISVPTHGSHHQHQAASSGEPIQSVLLDTTEQSSLGWTRYPDGGPGGQGRTPGWSEETFLQVERDVNWRSFVTCDVAYQSVNNWLWTPLMERGEAQRLYIELKFTMRNCNLFPQMVLSCKETFALLYKEFDEPPFSGAQSAANASFALSDTYTQVGVIAANAGRFTTNNDVVINTEIRSLPVSKRLLHFAFRDQGACLSLISIRVYALKCAPLASNFARFNATHTARELLQLVPVEGECVANAIEVERPRRFCAADGSWNSMSSGQCRCAPGFEPANNQTKCQACPPGRFKAEAGDSPCLPCPERSSTAAGQLAATECRCHEGFFRATRDSRSTACTQPPAGPPQNLTATYADSTSLVLQWQAPWRPATGSGGRDDLSYKLVCDGCDFATLVSSPQFLNNFSETKCVLAGLAPATNYRFLVYAMNGVSALAAAAQLATGQPQLQQPFSEITIQTSRPAPRTNSNTLSSQNGGFQLLPIYNFRALPGARGHDMLLAWDAGRSGLAADSADLLLGGPTELSGGGGEQPSLYEIKFAPRFAQLQANGAGASPEHSPYALLRRTSHSFADAPPGSVAPNQPQQISTTNRAVGVYSLQVRTEYAFQIRAKWHSSAQWTDWSEPVFAQTGSGGSGAAYAGAFPPAGLFTPTDGLMARNNEPGELLPVPFDPRNPIQLPPPIFGPQHQQPTGAATWLSSFLFVLLCCALLGALLVITLLHFRRSPCSLKSLSHSLGAGLMGSNVGSTYAGVYNGGASSDLVQGAGAATPSALYGANTRGLIYANGQLTLAHHQAHHHHAHSGSAGALITGSNSTSRSSSGAGNVVQNFIAATLGQLAGGAAHNQQQQQQSHVAGGKTLGASPHEGHKLFLGPQSGHQQAQAEHQNGGGGELAQRNHYHQMLGNVNHTLLLSGQHGQYQPTPLVPANGQHHNFQQQLANFAAANSPQVADLFGQPAHHHHHHHHQQQQSKYGNSRTLSGQQQYGALQQEPAGQLQHIYDDLEVVSQESRDCSPPTGHHQLGGPAPNSVQQQQQQRRDSNKQQLRQIYAAREIYDAVAAANGQPHVIGPSGAPIVQPLAASRTTAAKPAHQFYKELGRQRADEEFYDQ